MRALPLLALAVLAVPLTAAALVPADLPLQAVTGPVSMSFLTGFSPPLVVVGNGGAVTFTNSDSIHHSVTDYLGSFDVVLNPGQSVTLHFAGPGAVVYHCTFHPNMNGLVLATP
jgi:plastocyanin